MLSIGSPIPMKTAVVDLLDAAEVERLVEDLRGVRFRPKRIDPVAQNVHVSGQPDWDERQRERRPSRYRMSTASTGWPSAVRKSALTVPSRERHLLLERQRRVRNRVGELARRGRREVRHLPVAGRAACRPRPYLPGAVGGLAALGEGALEQDEIHDRQP